MYTDLEAILDFCNRVDPNGDYTMTDLLANPEGYAEMLQEWCQDMGTEYTHAEMAQLVSMISTLVAYGVYLRFYA